MSLPPQPVSPPGEQTLARAEAELRALPRGSTRAVGGGVHMRFSNGVRSFVIRPRKGAQQKGFTYRSWQEAQDALQRLIAAAPPAPAPGATPSAAFEMAPGPGDVIGPTLDQLLNMTFRDYRRLVYWPWAKNHLGEVTLRDYRRLLRDDVEPIIGDYTLAQLAASPLIVDHLMQQLAERKTYPKTRTRKGKTEKHPRAGEIAKAACDAAITAASSVAKHAVMKRVWSRNIFQGIARFNVEQTVHGTRNARYRRAKPSEVMHPRTLARVASGLRGTWARVEERRAAYDMIAYGWRPEDVLGTRHRDWRDLDGRPYPQARIRQAVKDLGSVLILGGPKTGTRDPQLFGAVAWQLERVYQAQGCPDLEHLLVTNNRGGLLDWNNSRRDDWYPALDRSGLAAGIDTDSPGAFDPYLLRHIGVSTMSHAQRPEGGTYSIHEVARQFGHSPETLLKVYADIPEDLHGIAGLTMDEIIWAARREIYGPMPIDPDFDDRLYTIKQAAELLRISPGALVQRVARRAIPAHHEGGRTLISEFDLAWLGLIDPASRRR
jgi:hypothetical protein